MNRRRLLVAAGTLASSTLAGCLGSGGSSGSGTSTDTETRTTTLTATTTRTSTATSSPTTARTPIQESTTLTGTDEPTTGSEPSTGTATASPGSTTTQATRTTDSTTRSSTAGSNRIVDRTITIGDRACGTRVSEGTIAFEERRVDVSGTITGSDSCATAVLDETTYDAGADRLRIVVATESESQEGTVCSQCLTEIDYEARVTFTDRVPETVVLVHRGATGEIRVSTATA